MKTISHYIDAARNRANKFINERRGWKTDRHILVIESDDWGSIRTSSLQALERLNAKGVNIPYTPFNTCDSLATNDDLELLMDVLSSIKDINNNPAKITLDTCVANPDFDKIKASNYAQYYYEPFTETLKRYPNCDKSFDLWQKGIEEKVFQPQFHGREHLNVPLMMKLLQSRYQPMLDCFNEQMYSLEFKKSKLNRGRHRLLEAYDYVDDSEIEQMKRSVIKGLQLFERIFGFVSKSMIAPCYTWDLDIENVAKSQGVEYIQGAFRQHLPKRNSQKQQYHYIGEENANAQIYLVRNCLYEPAHQGEIAEIQCLKEIEKAFALKKPAIVCSHRINYIGALNTQNRDRTLKGIKYILTQVKQKYPDVEFMSSDELGQIIKLNK
jgi:hypothetical protein